MNITKTEQHHFTKTELHHGKFLAGYLKRIPNDGRYETWSKVGLLIHTLTVGDMVGVHLFYHWSKQSARHTDEGFISFWRDHHRLAAMDLLSEMANPKLQQLGDIPTSPTIH